MVGEVPLAHDFYPVWELHTFTPTLVQDSIFVRGIKYRGLGFREG